MFNPGGMDFRFGSSGVVDLGSHMIEHTDGFRSEKLHPAHDGKHDQSADEAVFDRGGAALVRRELPDYAHVDPLSRLLLQLHLFFGY